MKSCNTNISVFAQADMIDTKITMVSRKLLVSKCLFHFKRFSFNDFPFASCDLTNNMLTDAAGRLEKDGRLMIEVAVEAEACPVISAGFTIGS